MQRIVELRGVLFINDSKGTTVAATEAALDGLEKPVLLIAGVDGKLKNISELKE
jgi:UDP-N-acetylmuramoylalanine--D-glutamate ligase